MKARRLIYVPLWIQVTITALVISIVALIVISSITGVKSWDMGSTLIGEKLSSLAVLEALTLHQNIQNSRTDTQFILSRDYISEFLQDLYPETYTNASAAELHLTNLSYLLKTSFLAKSQFRAALLYGNNGTRVYSLIHSDSSSSISAILASLDVLCPLESIDGDPKQLFGNTSTVFVPRVISTSSRGAPLYSMSFTMPITSTSSNGTTSTIGYGTLVIELQSGDIFSSQISTTFSGGTLAIMLPAATGFRYVGGYSLDSTLTSDPTAKYPFESYPAVLAASNLTYTDSSNLPRLQWLRTRTNSRQEASVGCTLLVYLGAKFVVCAEIGQSIAFESVYALRNKVIGLCFGMLGFILLVVIPVCRWMTRPMYRIYEQMVLPGQLKPPPTTAPKKSKDGFLAALWFFGIGKRTRAKRDRTASPAPGPIPVTQVTSNATGENFQVPNKVQPLNRLYKDELDILVDEYDHLVDELNNQYYFLEDQVKERTREAQAARIEAEKANEAKGQFIANITHELRTPLNGIMGMTSVTLSETALPKVRASLGVIIESARTLMNLLNELLAFSRSQIDMEAKISEFPLSDVINSVQSQFTTIGAERNLKFEMFCDPPSLSSARFNGDGHRITQVVMNIMSNSIKFSSPNSKITMIIRYTTSLDDDVIFKPYFTVEALSPKKSKGILEIIIVDSGKGIPEDKMPYIFEPFVQGDDAYNKNHQGTGLGMSMCKQLSETVGGCVKVWSLENRGTCSVVKSPVLGDKSLPLSPPLNLNRNGMMLVSSKEVGIVQRYVSDPKSGVRLSFLSSDDSILDEMATGSISNSHFSSGSAISPNNSVLEKAKPSRKGLSAVGAYLASIGHRRRPTVSTGPGSAKSDHSRGHHLRSSISTYQSSKIVDSSVVKGPIPYNQKSANASSRSELTQSTNARSEPSPTLSAESSFKDMFAELNVGEHAKEQFLQRSHEDFKALVADDNALNLEIMVKMLAKLGIENVDTATDGEKVVKLVEKSIREGYHYNVIFMDLSMPRLNGFEATQVIRRTLGYPYPIVALTGFSDSRTKIRCREVNIHDVIVKPVLRNALVAVLAKYDCEHENFENDDIPGLVVDGVNVH